MNKFEFKTRWEKDDNGDGITNNEIAECAKAWGIFTQPRTQPISEVRYRVLQAAGTIDAEEFKPEQDEDWN